MSNNLSESFSNLIQSADLVEVTLKSSNFDCKVPARTVVAKDTRLDHSSETEYIVSDSKDLLVCFVSVTTKGVSNLPEQKDKLIFEMTGTFSLVYTLSKTDFDPKAYGLFAEKNAVFNAYPYLRELFQNFSVRAGLPPVLLPLFKPATKKEIQGELKEKKASEQKQ